MESLTYNIWTDVDGPTIVTVGSDQMTTSRVALDVIGTKVGSINCIARMAR